MDIWDLLLYIALLLVGCLIGRGLYAIFKRTIKVKWVAVLLSVLLSLFVIYIVWSFLFCGTRNGTACMSGNLSCIRGTRVSTTPFGDLNVGGLRYIPF